MATHRASNHSESGGTIGGEFVDSRVRLRRLAILFGLATAVLFARLAWMEWSDGPRFRQRASKPIERRHWIDGVRGRILSRDGKVLAEDRPVLSVALNYRWLEDPPNAEWIRRVARQRLARQGLPRRVRRDPQRIAAEIELVISERNELRERLAALAGISPGEWQARTAAIQSQVESVAQRVNARRLEKYAAELHRTQSPLAPTASGWARFRSTAAKILFPADVAAPPPRITIAEELESHIVADDVPLEVVAHLEALPQLFPGTRIVQQSRRAYPAGDRAAHLVGHLGRITSEELRRARSSPEAGRYPRASDHVGRLGIERQYDRQLRGEAGVELELTDFSGKLLSKHLAREPSTGRDVVLTINALVQSAAESLLDAALERTQSSARDSEHPGGGAIVVLDAKNGAVLALASAPRFDPAAFSESGVGADAILSASDAPLLDRTIKMALPPGSVFKLVTAIALLEEQVTVPKAPFFCQGYLRDPDHERCALFVRQGEGHGDMTLETALMQSCNVYFLHHAEALGAARLLAWGNHCGFGQKTGIDLPNEVTGRMTLEGKASADAQAAARQLRAASIGQATLTVTPVQVARLMAAIANGGRLVTPHVVSDFGLSADSPVNSEVDPRLSSAQVEGGAHEKIPHLHTSTLETIRRALVRVVADPAGSAHASVHLEGLPIAGKTGTAEAGENEADHAWFAGYAPADSPRVAFAVALEHGGGGSEAAGPVARRLVQRLAQLGYLGRGAVARASHQQPRK